MTDPAPPPASPGRRPDEAGQRAIRAARAGGVRYGISLVAAGLGVYLALNWNPNALISLREPLWVLQSIAQLAIAVLVLAGGLAVAPSSALRGLLAAVLAVVAVSGAALLQYLRITGELLVGPAWFWVFVHPGVAALAAAILGWLIVRRRPVLTYPLVLGALIPGLVRWQLLLAGVDPAVLWFVDVTLTAVVGVIAAWLAYGVAAALRSASPARRGEP